MSRRLLVVGAFLLVAQLATAAAPKLDALFPPGGRQGATVAPVVVLGKTDKWPVSAWCSHPDIKIEPEELKNRLQVTIGTNVPPGPHLIRLFDAAGASAAKPFIVSRGNEVLEYGYNENRAKAEEVKSLPVIINGRLERSGDSDFYRLPLKVGQLLTARLDGYSLGSLIDPFIRLLDPRGYEIAVASDTHNLDPFLQHRIEESGEYRLQIFAIAHKASTSVSYSGSASAVYRLHLTTDANARLGLPIKAGRNEEDGTKLVGPVTVVGSIGGPGESDEFTFEAKKGGQYLVRVEARRWHYVWDPVLTVHRPDGRLLREVDDTKPTADAEYSFKASQDGLHKITIKDRFGTGGSEHRYRLVIEQPEPVVKVTIDKDRFELKPGKTVDLKLKLDRKHGHQAELTASCDNLPQGVILEAKPIEAKAKTATLKLRAAEDAAAFNGAFRLHLKESKDTVHVAAFSFVTGDSRGDYLVNEMPDLWLTVTEPVEEKDSKKK